MPKRFSPPLLCARWLPYLPTLHKSCNFLFDCATEGNVSLERVKGLGHVVKRFDAPLEVRCPGFLLIAFRIVFCAFVF